MNGDQDAQQGNGKNHGEAELQNEGRALTVSHSSRSVGRYSLRSRPAPIPIYNMDDEEDPGMEFNGFSKKKGKGNKRHKSKSKSRLLGKRKPKENGHDEFAGKDIDEDWYDPQYENIKYEPGEHYYDQIILSKLPKNVKKLNELSKEVSERIDELKEMYLQEVEINKSSLDLILRLQ